MQMVGLILNLQNFQTLSYDASQLRGWKAHHAFNYCRPRKTKNELGSRASVASQFIL
jgi:hypothetical protein